MRRIAPLLLAVVALVAACSNTGPAVDVDAPTPISGEEMETLLATSTQPLVVNVWASWCIPCRSEAPLLNAAVEGFADEIRFVMLNVQDSPSGATGFIAEFYPDTSPPASDLMEHYANASGDIPVQLGGNRGVPMTFFYGPGGELVSIHFGVIDERTLALQIDELLVR